MIECVFALIATMSLLRTINYKNIALKNTVKEITVKTE